MAATTKLAIIATEPEGDFYAVRFDRNPDGDSEALLVEAAGPIPMSDVVNEDRTMRADWREVAEGWLSNHSDTAVEDGEWLRSHAGNLWANEA